MEEPRKEIPGFEGLYEITPSGRIYSCSRKRFMARCGDEYGFHIVKLSKNGKGKNFNVYTLWKSIYKDAPKSDFKGALNAKY